MLNNVEKPIIMEKTKSMDIFKEMPTTVTKPLPTTTKNVDEFIKTSTTTPTPNSTTTTTTAISNFNNNIKNNKNTTTIHISDDVNSNASIFIKAASQRGGVGVGVQNLRNLWNQRILENTVKAQQQQQQQLQQQQSHQLQQQQQQSNKRTQSISCLNSMASWRSSNGSNYSNGMQKSARAQSLHDCSTMHTEQITSVVRERDRMQREKDNFYKYKTAEQAARHRARLLSRRSTLSGGSDDEIFGEQIEPIIDRALSVTDTGSDKSPTSVFYSTKITINDNDLDNYVSSPPPTTLPPPLPPPPLPPPRLMRNNSVLSECLITTDKLNAIDKKMKNKESLQQKIPKISKNNIEKKLPLDNNDIKPLNSGSSGVRHLNISGSTRRYSFKTHVRTYPIGGKMSRDSSSINNSSNIVARLTQQFNNIIQNDKKLLEEIKRKNGVLMARGGHIYKVVENTELINSNNNTNNNNKQNGIKRSGSRVRDSSISSVRNNLSAVQKQIRRFEHKDQQPHLENNKNISTNTIKEK